MKRKLFSLLSVLMILTMACPAVLAYSKKAPSASTKSYITAVAPCKMDVYEKANLKTKQKTVNSRGKTITRYVSAGDVCKIISIDNKGKSIEVEYPLDGGGTNTGWVSRKKFTAANLAKAQMYGSPGKSYDVYKTPGEKWGTSKIYADDDIFLLVDPDDDSVAIYDEDGYYQVIYPVTSNGTYKMGWVKAKTFSVS